MKRCSALLVIAALAGGARADLIRASSQESEMQSFSRVRDLGDDDGFVRVESEQEFVQGLFATDSEVFGSRGAAYGRSASGFDIQELSDEAARLQFRGGSDASAAVGNVDRSTSESNGEAWFVLEFELLEESEFFIEGELSAMASDRPWGWGRIEASLGGVFFEDVDSEGDDGEVRFETSGVLRPGRYQLEIRSWAEALAGDTRNMPRAAYGESAYEISIELESVNPAPSALATLALAGVIGTRRRR